MGELSSTFIINGDPKLRTYYANSNLGQLSDDDWENQNPSVISSRYEALVSRSINSGDYERAQNLFKEYVGKMVMAYRKAGAERKLAEMNIIINWLQRATWDFPIISGIGVMADPFRGNDITVIIQFRTLNLEKPTELSRCESSAREYLSRLKNFQDSMEKVLAWRDTVRPEIAPYTDYKEELLNSYWESGREGREKAAENLLPALQTREHEALIAKLVQDFDSLDSFMQKAITVHMEEDNAGSYIDLLNTAKLYKQQKFVIKYNYDWQQAGNLVNFEEMDKIFFALDRAQEQSQRDWFEVQYPLLQTKENAALIAELEEDFDSLTEYEQDDFTEYVESGNVKAHFRLLETALNHKIRKITSAMFDAAGMLDTQADLYWAHEELRAAEELYQSACPFTDSGMYSAGENKVFGLSEYDGGFAITVYNLDGETIDSFYF